VNAGHPPPLVRRQDGSVAYLEGGSLPLGAMALTRYEEVPVELAPGSVVLLYTDGLVERRSQSLDAGLGELQQMVGEGPSRPGALCRSVLDAVFDRQPPDDDVAVMALQLTGLPGGRLVLDLPAEPASLWRLRRGLRAWLERGGARHDEVYGITLAVGEAAANVVEHAYGPGDASFRVEGVNDDGEVTVTVRDSGQWREPRGADRGRGLLLMEAFMDHTAVHATDQWTSVELRRHLGVGDRQREPVLA
jgi:anti-sigma regulatory factor (Ser/Thr protein kinase)